MRLKGTLGEFPLADVIQFLGFGRRTGRLHLINPAHSSVGNLYFHDGEVVHATMGERSGEDAVVSLLSLEEGTFEFRNAEEIPVRTLKVGINQILLRAAQQMDQKGQEYPGGEPEGETDIIRIKTRMKEMILTRLGRKGKKVVAAIDTSGDTLDGLLGVCERIEKYVTLFFDHELGEKIGKELREIVGF